MASASGSKTTGTKLDFFLRSVGYPERAPEGAVSFMLRVDGLEVLAEELDGRIVLSCMLIDDVSKLPTLASYAVGRIMKEEATLSWGNGAFLWQDAPADSGGREFMRLFETFMDSCDWWRERVDTLRGGVIGVHGAEDDMVIRP